MDTKTIRRLMHLCEVSLIKCKVEEQDFDDSDCIHTTANQMSITAGSKFTYAMSLLARRPS